MFSAGTCQANSRMFHPGEENAKKTTQKKKRDSPLSLFHLLLLLVHFTVVAIPSSSLSVLSVLSVLTVLSVLSEPSAAIL